MKTLTTLGFALALATCQAPLRSANAADDVCSFNPKISANSPDCYDPSECIDWKEGCAKEQPPPAPTRVRFQPWQAIWQCNDIKIVEFSNQQGLIEYDLSGTVWGGSHFARDLNRDMLFFNGRPCWKITR
jgi:hypothetical protein